MPGLYRNSSITSSSAALGGRVLDCGRVPTGSSTMFSRSIKVGFAVFTYNTPVTTSPLASDAKRSQIVKEHGSGAGGAKGRQEELRNEPNWDATPTESTVLEPSLDNVPNEPLPATRVARGELGLRRSG